jgi:hypothetical protein
MAVVDADPYAEVKERLRTDWPFYAESFLRIVDRQRIVPFVPKPAQLRLWNALVAQRDSGRPMRGYVLKARKIGFSTMGQGLGLQRVTQRPNHNMLTVAQDNSTAQELFAIAELMYANVPDHEALRFLKPKITHQRRSRALHFGEDSRQRLAGQLGLNSKMLVDTANEFEAGRGFTYHTLLLSEVAFWADLKKKLTSLLNTVPHDDPDTLVLMESTANGHDYFKWLWDQAEAGTSDYLCFFSPWFEDEKYRRKFADETERAEFIEGLGQGAWGEDEPDLRTLIADSVVGWAAELNTVPPSPAVLETRVLEHLHWRRWAIENLAGHDLHTFNVEYPSTPAMAFSVASKNVFAPLAVQKARVSAEITDPQCREVTWEVTDRVLRRGRHIAVEVPTRWRSRPRNERSRSDLFWRVWSEPKDKGQYIMVIDPAEGEEVTERESDFTGIQIIDHHTGVQVAEMETRADPDLVAEQAFVMATEYSVKPNMCLIVVEITGGYGTSIINRLWKQFGYKRMYFRTPVDARRKDKSSDLVGFSTDRHTKPLLVDGMKELIREGTHGIRSLKTVKQVEAYQRFKNGRTGAAPGSFDDLLTPYMAAQYVRTERPPRRDRKPGDVVNMATRAVRNPVTGY